MKKTITTIALAAFVSFSAQAVDSSKHENFNKYFSGLLSSLLTTSISVNQTETMNPKNIKCIKSVLTSRSLIQSSINTIENSMNAAEKKSFASFMLFLEQPEGLKFQNDMMALDKKAVTQNMSSTEFSKNARQITSQHKKKYPEAIAGLELFTSKMASKQVKQTLQQQIPALLIQSPECKGVY